MSEIRNVASEQQITAADSGRTASEVDRVVLRSAVKLLDKLSRRIKRQASEARTLSQRVGKSDSDYYFGIAEGLDRAATQIRGEYIRAKATEGEQGREPQ